MHQYQAKQEMYVHVCIHHILPNMVIPLVAVIQEENMLT